MSEEIQKTLIDELGLSSLSAEKKDQLLIKMTEVVLERIFLGTMEKLNEADQDKYSKMIDENAEPEQLEKFLQEKISDYEGMVSKVVAGFVEEMKKVDE